MVGKVEHRTDSDVVARYKATYCMPPEAEVSDEQVRRHWELEQQLTRELLGSSPQNRQEVFERCYSELYREIEWTQGLKTHAKETVDAKALRIWTSILGPPPLRILEIGSGGGGLIYALAESGYDCKGTDVTRERGEILANAHPNLVWGTCDGHHPELSEPAASWDVVISNQVIEHLHPDDIGVHIRGVAAVLKPGGRYIFTTPHKAFGPKDISRVFGCSLAKGMHLREYSNIELVRLLRRNGFSSVRAPMIPPRRLCSLLRLPYRSIESGAYLNWICWVDRILDALSPGNARRSIARASKLVGMKEGVWLIASTPRGGRGSAQSGSC
jgi:2-polyprenyl-3-methyl-5-hydroxy-6-metoxy-1,4-benzoquinol methylase